LIGATISFLLSMSCRKNTKSILKMEKLLEDGQVFWGRI
jgi:hypothetical protein